MVCLGLVSLGLAVPVVGAETLATLDLAQAEALLAIGDAEGALGMLIPCLAEAPGRLSPDQLRECLIIGERAGEGFLDQLMGDAGIGDREVARRWDAAGLTTHWRYSLPRWYRHDFGRRLVELFPEDPLAPEISYKILQIDAVRPWPESPGLDEQRFHDFIGHHEGTRWAALARLDLARYLASMWDVFVHPEQWEGQREAVVTGDSELDLEFGLAMRRRALDLYAEVLACAQAHPEWFGADDLEEVEPELLDLIEGRPPRTHAFSRDC